MKAVGKIDVQLSPDKCALHERARGDHPAEQRPLLACDLAGDLELSPISYDDIMATTKYIAAVREDAYDIDILDYAGTVMYYDSDGHRSSLIEPLAMYGPSDSKHRTHEFPIAGCGTILCTPSARGVAVCVWDVQSRQLLYTLDHMLSGPNSHDDVSIEEGACAIARRHWAGACA